ncbi:hypothetical protein OSG_eHP16_00160 [environmental Halophage eHP-16]|nr:hypothetical protein OSG_eHP16_00160 [environmental Halophage eHP-16]
MADNDNSLFDRARSFVARLGPGQDGNPSVQARDEDPHTVGREEFREEADELDIGRFVREYNRNPLIRVPIQNFASDVTEPGVSVDVDTGDDADVPVVPDSAPDEYAGRDLDDALEAWLSQCYIDGWSYHGDIGALLENVIKDRRGRRGTAIIEHVYDDARERERLMKLRPVRVETVTAYTREGKRIVLRGDDDAGSFDTIAVSDYGDPVRDIAPKTPAGQTAAIAQFDDVFGSQEREEIPFAYGDISFSAYDSDTGVLFGRPDSATILNRARSLRKKLRHVDQSVTNTAFGNILAQVETQQREVVESVRDNLDVNIKDRGVRDENPQTVSATNAEIDVHEIDASVPDVVDIIQQEIEFILTAMPTPLYRVGFAGDINRDVTSEQGEDYRDAVKRERRRLEDDFRRMLRLKAKGLLLGNPHTDESLDVDVSLRIRPSTSESPLRDEEFDASEFSNLMSGLSTAAGPKGGATAILPKEVIIDTVLDMDSEEVLGDDDTPPGDNAPAMPAQSDAVQAAFDDFTDGPDVAAETDLDTDTEELANRYQEGDVVDTPESGVGVIAGAVAEDQTAPEDSDLPDIEASPDSPTYVVVTEDESQGMSLLKASDLEATEIEAEVDALDTTKEAAAMAELAPDDSDSEIAELDFTMPESWRESDTPARVIALDAFASMGGSFDGCVRSMRDAVSNPDALCGSFLDEVLGYEAWRGDSPLPGD